MRLLTFTKNGVRKLGLFKNDAVIDLPKAYLTAYDATEVPEFLYDMRKFISVGNLALDVAKYLEKHAAGDAYLKPAEIRWEPPVPNPEKIFAVAVNYRAHGQEAGVRPPEKPYFFPKFPNALVGHEGYVVKHRVAQKVDWEVELVVVMGRPGKYIPPEKALDYVFGYAVGNDISIRDWQFPPGWPQQLNPYGQNWIWGKSMDTAAPVGPFIVTKDEVPDPNKLGLRLWVNGQLEQEGTVGKRPAGTGGQHLRAHLQRPTVNPLGLPRHNAEARRPHIHRHPARRRLPKRQIPKRRRRGGGGGGGHRQIEKLRN